MNLNTATFGGRLARDPESTATPTGKSVTKFTLVFDSGYGDYKKPVFMPVEAWGKAGEVIVKYLGKGDPLLVQGEIKQDTWEKDGQKRSMMKLNLQKFSFAGGKQQQQGEPAPEAPKQEMSKEEEDSIPF